MENDTCITTHSPDHQVTSGYQLAKGGTAPEGGHEHNDEGRISPLPNKPEIVGCCTDEKIAEGKQWLDKRFAEASDKMKTLGLTPVRPGEVGASCKNSSGDILEWLQPFPTCWRCHLEERDKHPGGDPDRSDHQVIICRSYGKDGAFKNEIMYDWWGRGKWKTPKDFRDSFPYLPGTGKCYSPPAYSGCDGKPVTPTQPRCGFDNCIEGL